MAGITFGRATFFLALSALIPSAFAGSYNAKWSGTVTSLSTYSYNDQIIFALSTMPSLPSGTCNTTAFAISKGDTAQKGSSWRTE